MAGMASMAQVMGHISYSTHIGRSFFGGDPMIVSNHETSWLYILEDCWTVNVGYQTGHSIEAGKIIATSPQPGPPKW